MIMHNQTNRLYSADNIKAFLICCVVLGHLCEVLPFQGSSYLYLLIYSFHMPAFSFLTGMMATYHPGKIARNLVYPYLVFQLLYLVFCNQLLDQQKDIQFTKPYWLMWYLMATIVWHLAIPFLELVRPGRRWLALAAMMALSLAIGYDESISYYLSLSRILVMLPFFAAGFYFRRSAGYEKLAEALPQKSSRKRTAKLLLGTGALAAAVLLYLFRHDLRASWLYGSYPYEKLQYGAAVRGLSLGIAFVFIFLFLAIFPNRPLPLITRVGQHTMPVYLAHGFILRILQNGDFSIKDWADSRLEVLLLTAAMVLLLSSRPVRKLLAPLMHYPFGKTPARAASH